MVVLMDGVAIFRRCLSGPSFLLSDLSSGSLFPMLESNGDEEEKENEEGQQEKKKLLYDVW